MNFTVTGIKQFDNVYFYEGGKLIATFPKNYSNCPYYRNNWVIINCVKYRIIWVK